MPSFSALFRHFEYEPGNIANTDQATIWRWRPDYQYDFAARMDWCVTSSYDGANHNPVPWLNGDGTKAVMTVSAGIGDVVALSAEGTTDPDGDSVTVRWFIYPEAGTMGSGATLSATEGLTTQVSLPASATGTLHVILHAQDDGNPNLSAYRRAIIDVR